jgi:hypothetical protein
MDQVPYQAFAGLENVYLEDSYVLDIRIKQQVVELFLLVVLTEQHAFYATPPATEQYCYRKALLQFTNVGRVTWIMKSLVQNTDAAGTVDYGNIDEFFWDGECFNLSGDWGKLEIKSSPPTLEIELSPR